ncbi:MAG: SDR family oxidoreductase, partial [Pseudomonadota bacterium]
MAGKRGLVMGVANDHSIAWGIATALHAAGAEMAFTYQGEPFGKRVKPLAQSIGVTQMLPCDVDDETSLTALFDHLRETWGSLDFVVHAIAYSDKEELKGRYLDTSRANFRRTLLVSCYSFTQIARMAAPMMAPGGSLVTLSYIGAERVTPNYNVMGVAKAALEASVRYLATDLGSDGIRVNCISAGPVRTLAGSAIADARFTYGWTRDQSPMHRP